MLNRKLKNYKIYLQRLKLFAQAMNIKIEYGELDAEGTWMPAIRKIKLDDDDLSQSFELAALLHELGHSMDDLLSTAAKEENALFKAYKAVYESKKGKKPTAKQLILVTSCEKRAWDNGRGIAHRLNIRLGKWYDEAERVCISSYKEV